MSAIRTFQVLVLSAALPMAAGATQKEKSWTGTLTALRDGKTITVSDALQSKTFDISPTCLIQTANKTGMLSSATLSELQPGEQLVVSYQRINGALVANSIADKLLKCTGTVGSIESQDGATTLELKSVLGLGAARAFRCDNSCEMLLRNGQVGKLEDLKPGDKVTLLYKLSNGVLIACRVQDAT